MDVLTVVGLVLCGITVGVVTTVLTLGLLARWIKRRTVGSGTDEKQQVGEEVIAIVRNA